MTKTAEYEYDVFDRRISKSVDADGLGSGVAAVEQYVYDGAEIALRFNGDGSLTNRYLHGPVVDMLLADESFDPAGPNELPTSPGDVLWAAADHLNTIRDQLSFEPAGNSGTGLTTIANHLDYDSFGNIVVETVPGTSLLFTYTGRQRDAETGVMYYRARYYDPAAGRFLSEDPIYDDYQNLSRYVANNPLTATDPSGLAENPPPTRYFDGANGKRLQLGKKDLIDVKPQSPTGRPGTTVTIHAEQGDFLIEASLKTPKEVSSGVQTHINAGVDLLISFRRANEQCCKQIKLNAVVYQEKRTNHLWSLDGVVDGWNMVNFEGSLNPRLDTLWPSDDPQRVGDLKIAAATRTDEKATLGVPGRPPGATPHAYLQISVNFNTSRYPNMTNYVARSYIVGAYCEETGAWLGFARFDLVVNIDADRDVYNAALRPHHPQIDSKQLGREAPLYGCIIDMPVEFRKAFEQGQKIARKPPK